MNTIHTRVKTIKSNMLDIIENRLKKDISCEDLQSIAETLNKIDEDKNIYYNLLASTSQGWSGEAKCSEQF